MVRWLAGRNRGLPHGTSIMLAMHNYPRCAVTAQHLRVCQSELVGSRQTLKSSPIPWHCSTKPHRWDDVVWKELFPWHSPHLVPPFCCWSVNHDSSVRRSYFHWSKVQDLRSLYHVSQCSAFTTVLICTTIVSHDTVSHSYCTCTDSTPRTFKQDLCDLRQRKITVCSHRPAQNILVSCSQFGGFSGRFLADSTIGLFHLHMTSLTTDFGILRVTQVSHTECLLMASYYYSMLKVS